MQSVKSSTFFSKASMQWRLMRKQLTSRSLSSRSSMSVKLRTISKKYLKSTQLASISIRSLQELPRPSTISLMCYLKGSKMLIQFEMVTSHWSSVLGMLAYYQQWEERNMYFWMDSSTLQITKQASAILSFFSSSLLARMYSVSAMYVIFLRLKSSNSRKSFTVWLCISSAAEILSRNFIVIMRFSSTFMWLETATSGGNFSTVFSIRLMSLVVELSSQGQKPYSISQKITPRDQISALLSQMDPFRISGAMLMGNPTTVWAIPQFIISLQNPKSPTLTTPLWKRMLVDLRFRCRIFSLVNSSKADRSWVKILMASSSGSLFLDLMQSSRVPPLQYSYTKQYFLAVASISMKRMMLGWLIFVRISISLFAYSLKSNVCEKFSRLMTLTANSSPLVRCSARYTSPYCPFPIFSISTQSPTIFFIFKLLCISYMSHDIYMHVLNVTRPACHMSCMSHVLHTSCIDIFLQSLMITSSPRFAISTRSTPTSPATQCTIQQQFCRFIRHRQDPGHQEYVEHGQSK